MAIRWNTIIIWLVIEISLNFLGIDEIFDCSEFLFRSSFLSHFKVTRISFDCL